MSLKDWKIPLGIYLGLRSLSFIFQPNTPLHAGSVFNNIFAGLTILIAAYFLAKKNIWGWYIVAGEILLGGSGNFFSFLGISLRTCLLLTSLSFFFFWEMPPRVWKKMYRNNLNSCHALGVLLVIVGLSATRGFFFHHSFSLLRADVIPYLFFLYYFPLQNIFSSGQDKQKFFDFSSNCLTAAIIGNALFTLFTFVNFSGLFFHLQDTYYHWFRDAANGKITELPFHFYRIVLNEQLLLVPLVIYFLNRIIIKNNTKTSIFLASCLIFILSVNLTRIYIVALVLGLGMLFGVRYWKRWLACSILTLAAFFSIFTLVHLTASRGESLGFELFGIRLQSIVAPSIEDSSLSRTLLLPKIIEKIKARPLLGNGLGDIVTVYSPVAKQQITTSQFDWGWLEIFDELGLFGLVAWLILIGFIFSLYRKNKNSTGSTAALVTLMTSTLTAPIIFHVLGILWITVSLAKNQLNDQSRSPISL